MASTSPPLRQLPDSLQRHPLFQHVQEVRSLILPHGAAVFGPLAADAPGGDGEVQSERGYLTIFAGGTMATLSATRANHLRNLAVEFVETVAAQDCAIQVFYVLAYFIEFGEVPTAREMRAIDRCATHFEELAQTLEPHVTPYTCFGPKRVPADAGLQRTAEALLRRWRTAGLEPKDYELALPWRMAHYYFSSSHLTQWLPKSHEIVPKTAQELFEREGRPPEEVLQDIFVTAGITAARMLPRLGYTIAPSTDLWELWPQWSLVNVGPSPVPERWRRLGARPYAESHITLDDSERDQLLSIIESCVAGAAYPAPRYLNCEIDVLVPRILRWHLRKWDIFQLTVRPHAEGIWCLPQRSDGPGPGFWWSTKEPYLYAHAGLDEALRLALAAVGAALWHDLCAEVITIEVSPEALQTRQSESVTRSRGRSVITLPPVRYVASWSNEAEQGVIEHLVSHPGRFRVLPRGWADRVNDPGFQLRQANAAKRAAEEQHEPPPPGYTYVKAHDRSHRGKANEVRERRPTVLSRGLLSITLGLASVLESAAARGRRRHAGDKA